MSYRVSAWVLVARVFFLALKQVKSTMSMPKKSKIMAARMVHMPVE